MRRLAILIVLSAFPLRSELLPIRTYTTADGLASDRIDGIVADSRGFLWFSTPEGLSRFDGSHFVSYGVDEGLPHAAVSALIETRSGDHWIGTPRGLSRIAASADGPRGLQPTSWGRRPRQTTLAPFWRRGPADSGPRPRGLSPAGKSPNGNGGTGIPNMRRRAESLGGRMELTSKSGEGCTVAIHIPARGGALAKASL